MDTVEPLSAPAAVGIRLSSILESKEEEEEEEDSNSDHFARSQSRGTPNPFQEALDAIAGLARDGDFDDDVIDDRKAKKVDVVEEEKSDKEVEVTAAAEEQDQPQLPEQRQSSPTTATPMAAK